MASSSKQNCDRRGMVERETAKDMVVRYSPGAKRITVGADKGFDTADFVSDMRDFNVTPHVAQNTTNRLSAIDATARCHRAAVRVGQRYLLIWRSQHLLLHRREALHLAFELGELLLEVCRLGRKRLRRLLQIGRVELA